MNETQLQQCFDAFVNFQPYWERTPYMQYLKEARLYEASVTEICNTVRRQKWIARVGREIPAFRTLLEFSKAGVANLNKQQIVLCEYNECIRRVKHILQQAPFYYQRLDLLLHIEDHVLSLYEMIGEMPNLRLLILKCQREGKRKLLVYLNELVHTITPDDEKQGLFFYALISAVYS